MTLQKEFYANFIVQRLTLKVINMDTLYLVFKDRFQFCESYLLRQDSSQLPYFDNNLFAQAIVDSNRVVNACQGFSFHPQKSFSRTKQPLPSNNPFEEAARRKLLFVAWMSTAVFQARRHYSHQLLFVKRDRTIRLSFSFSSRRVIRRGDF